MMNYFTRRLLPALLLAGLLSSTALAQNNIGTIDLRKVFDGYWKTKQADVGLKERAADMEKEHKNMVDDLKKGDDDYKQILASSNDQAVSAEERDKRKKTAESKLKYLTEQKETIVQYERQARTTLDEQRRRMRDNILGEIRTVVNAKSKTAGFSLVLDTAAESLNNTPAVLFSSGSHDITDDILKQLNASAPPDVLKPEVATPDKKDTEKKDTGKK
ncbi:MAG: OmpH family outer membrane protein [Verrucomicrobia bacterium]|nr:OmpH family outer membrane protein [Verrucomicrobiota bacterium]